MNRGRQRNYQVPTDAEAAVLETVRNFITERGYSPSYREIMSTADISSVSVVAYYLRNLQRAGLLTHHPGVSRSIVLTCRVPYPQTLEVTT